MTKKQTGYILLIVLALTTPTIIVIANIGIRTERIDQNAEQIDRLTECKLDVVEYRSSLPLILQRLTNIENEVRDIKLILLKQRTARRDSYSDAPRNAAAMGKVFTVP